MQRLQRIKSTAFDVVIVSSLETNLLRIIVIVCVSAEILVITTTFSLEAARWFYHICSNFVASRSTKSFVTFMSFIRINAIIVTVIYPTRFE